MPTILDLLQAGVHFGHKESHWHPKMKPYIFGARNGIHVIDLEQTLTRLNQALDFIRDLVARGGSVLILGSKRQAADIVKKYAEECGAPYVSGRWLGGTLTNFSEVVKLIRHYNDLKTRQASGALAKYTKKEQSQFAKEIADLENKVGGIKNVARPPDAIFVIDVKKEKTAVAEAVARKIPIIALVDTNVDPENIAYPIPSNDDAVKAIDLMTRLVCEAVKEGMNKAAERRAETAKAVAA